MPTECYLGIEVPQQIQEPCQGKYTSTDCTLSPNANIILDLPSGASQTETNAALTTALVYKEQQIEDLQNTLLTIDGSETKVEAGDNVTVTGTGTNLNPYVVNALSGGSQDLQSVLTIGGYGSIGSSFIAINDDSIAIQTASTSNTNNYARISTKWVDNIISTPQMEIQVNLNTTRLEFETPTVFSEIKVPAPLTAGIYTLLVCSNISYTVSNLPLGVLNNVAVVTDATAPTYLGTLVGGGSVVTPVWHNGTIWVSR